MAQFSSSCHSFFGFRTAQELALGWMGTFAERCTTLARLLTPCSLQQFSGLEGTEVCDGLRSGRNFMPSGAAALGFSKADRDILGGWSAEGSERYTRTAKFKIAHMQSAFAATFRNPDSDELAEAGDIDDLSDFLSTLEVPVFISLEPSTVDSELAAGEIVLDEIDLDTAMKKN